MKHSFSWISIAFAAIFGTSSVPAVSPTPTPVVSVQVSVSVTPKSVKTPLPTPTPQAPTSTPTPTRTPVSSESPVKTPTPTPSIASAKLLQNFLAKPSAKAFYQLCVDGASVKTPFTLVTEKLSKDRKSLVKTKTVLSIKDLLPQCGSFSSSQFIGSTHDTSLIIKAPLQSSDSDAKRLAVLKYNADVDARLKGYSFVMLVNANRGSGTKLTEMTFSLVFPEDGIRALLDQDAMKTGQATELTDKDLTALITHTGGSKASIICTSDLAPTIWYTSPPIVYW